MEGSKPEMPTIMLNSHMDVVPAFEEFWTHKPFAADIDERGNIFARGTQDTKSIGTQYLAALRYYKRNNIQFDRTIHVTFVPDEETGGLNGMKTFVESDFFKKMNVTFALDENGSSMQKDVFSIAYGERARWLVKFRIVSEAGHGADLFEKTASEKLVCLLNKVYDFRKTQQEILKKDPLDFSNTTAINLTMIKGGVLGNVIPSEYVLELDVRIGPNVDHDQLENMIKKWCEEIENVEYCFGEKGAQVAPSHFEGCCSNFCNGLAKAVEEM
jgi:N-acyl-L-amino-acid amidohydrolase